MMSAELIDAYRRTTYIVEASHVSPIAIRIGERCGAVDQLLIDRGASRWAFVTAYNPRSTRLSDGENQARHRKLVQRVGALSREMLPGRGVGDDASWAPEISLFIFEMEPGEARALGREFEQNAVVAGALGGCAELLVVAADFGENDN
ncbi:MAG: DUF3293 domain-containing protein [Pyrinomonadaceae bacterium]